MKNDYLLLYFISLCFIIFVNSKLGMKVSKKSKGNIDPKALQIAIKETKKQGEGIKNYNPSDIN